MDVKRISRRSLISLAISTTAYLFYRVAVHNSWIIVTRGAKRFAEGNCPSSLDPADEISLFVVGDTGLPSRQRAAVVSMMQRLARDLDPDAVVMLGDNFYEEGVHSVSDPRFQTDFELTFQPEPFDCPFHPALGNHDYLGNPLAQVDYSQHSDRWQMPATYYTVRYGAEHSSLDLFVIDTNPIHSATEGVEEQLQWLDQELSRSDATWKVVAGHHPCLSGGEHGASEEVNRRLAPLLTKHGVDLYVAGHEHDLQLLDSGQGWLQLISGSGSKLRSTSWIAETEFAAASAGFAWLLVQRDRLAVSIFGDQERLFTRVIPRSRTLAHKPQRSNPIGVNDVASDSQCTLNC